MRRRAALPIAVIAGFCGLLLLQSGAARGVNGGCSVASAPTIQSGQTQTSNPNACPDGRQYWAMNLKIGDSLALDIAPTPPPGGGFGNYGVGVYGPDVGTIGSSLCGNNYSSPTTETCLIPAAGRYVLVTESRGSFTPKVKSVPPQTGRVAGACDPANAPAAAPGVTQYANAKLCPATRAESWSIGLRRGDTLRVSVVPLPNGAGAAWVQLYGSGAASQANPLCGDGYYRPTTFTCRIPRDGRYVLTASQASGAFTPLPVHPTETDVAAPRFVKGGGAIPIRAAIRSNTAGPLGMCIVQERSGSRWAAVARARPRRGVCRASVPASRPGTVTLRVRFKGAKGWASSTSRPVKVVVG
jgi:hypothetical protein